MGGKNSTNEGAASKGRDLKGGHLKGGGAGGAGTIVLELREELAKELHLLLTAALGGRVGKKKRGGEAEVGKTRGAKTIGGKTRGGYGS